MKRPFKRLPLFPQKNLWRDWVRELSTELLVGCGLRVLAGGRAGGIWRALASGIGLRGREPENFLLG